MQLRSASGMTRIEVTGALDLDFDALRTSKTCWRFLRLEAFVGVGLKGHQSETVPFWVFKSLF